MCFGVCASRVGPLASGKGTTYLVNDFRRTTYGFNDFRTESQGQNLALTGLYVPYSLDGARVDGSGSVGFR